MGFLRSFLPWAVFFAFSAYDRIFLGLICAILTYLALNKMDLKKLKLLDKCSFAFFVAMIPVSFFHSWGFKEFGYVGNGFLALIILISILIDKPFTIEFAKESVPKEKWNTPQFIHVNKIISSFWLFYFVSSLPIIYLSSRYSPKLHVIQLVFLLVAIWATMWFPKNYKKKGHK